MAVTHFVTHFTHVSRHFGVYSRKQQKRFKENCFENKVSDVNKNGLKVHKAIFFKVRKLKKNKTKNNENIYNLCRIPGTKLLFLVDF